MATKSGKPPPKQYPFPRSATTPITGPAYVEGMTWDQARRAWAAYLRVVSNIHPMDLKPLNQKNS